MEKLLFWLIICCKLTDSHDYKEIVKDDFNGTGGSRLIFREEFGLRNQMYSRRFPAEVPRVDGKSMKRTTTLSRRYGHQEHCFEHEMVERSLGQRLKRRTGQGTENDWEAPRRNEGTNRGILKEECTEKSGQVDRGRHRRAIRKSSMNRRNSGTITLDSSKGLLPVK